LEALPSNQSDVVQSLDEAASIVARIGQPSIRTMFDSHNAVFESEPHATLVERHFDLIHHVHVNETDGKHCGQGDYNFKPVFEVLARRGYQGWISLEAFDFSFGSETIARESLAHLKRELERMAG
jgi:sugar phosphate isomerase/epimerase